MRRVIPLAGTKYGRWLVLDLFEVRDERVYWKVRCDCDLRTEKFVRADILKAGRSTRCGECPNEIENQRDGTIAILLERKDGSVLRAIIDAADYPLIQKYRWCARQSPQSRTTYAACAIYISSNKSASVTLHGVLCPIWPEVDHVDGDGLNNRRINLREATRAQQMMNIKKRRTKTSSQFKGVGWDKRRKHYRAYIQDNKKYIHLGYFNDEEDAARAYDDAAIKLFGDFASINFPLVAQ